ncbi:hypothetical protein M0R45_023562 [Rubus argutus]|uniref:Uncharacterized protein n=1 Tax=Rubus argutus TaxID=59490 RepID=A0AAW1WRN9_RUBAR
MCSETSPPRLSFLMILVKAEVLPKRDSSLLDLNCDFEFSISRSFRQDEPSSADELFSHGVIKPMQPRDRSSLRKHPKARQLILFLLFQIWISNNTRPHHQSKSFWGFKRSSSLNQDKQEEFTLLITRILKEKQFNWSAPNPKRGTSKLFCLSSFLIPWEGEKAKK